MELWNMKYISMPPNNSVKMKKVDIDIIHFKSILNGALKVMEEQHILHKEAALLSRFIYKLQRQFRGQKGLMCLYKVNRGLKRYISLDLQYVYNNFSKILSSVDINDEYAYVPTKQMLQYVLVQTQGFCKIMKYLSVACQDAALYFRGILSLGHLINSSLFSLSLVSRIWFCTRYFMICASQWYDQLLPYLEKLKIKGPCWLPKDYEFTENLGSWLGADPITGELKYDVDVQKISQDMSQTKGFEDVGTLVNREDFISQKKEKEGILQDKSLQMIFMNKKSKLLSTDLNAELIVNRMDSSPTTKNTPLKNYTNDLNEPISIEHSLTQEVETESKLATKNIFKSMPFQDFGEHISRDQFLAKKAKNKSVSKMRDEFRETNCDFQSKKSKLPLMTTTTFEGPNDIPEKSIGNNRILMLKTARNDIDETHTCMTSERKKNKELKKTLHTTLKLNKSPNITKTSINAITTCINGANEERERKKYLSPKALTDAFCSSQASQIKENKSLSKNLNDSKMTDVDVKKKTIDTSLSCMQMKDVFDQRIQPLKTLKDNKDIACMIEYKLNPKCISESMQTPINSGLKKKKKNSFGNWEIINGIRNLNDVKTFLHSEKKARARGKSSVTSQLNNSEWVVLFESINKFLKKRNVSKSKGNKKLKSVMEEIRNTLISFVI